MDKLFIKGTDETPEIALDKVNNFFEIKGRSLPEDVIEFYSRVFSWLEQYVSNPNEETILKVSVDYFNSASQRSLNEIFTILSRIQLIGKKITIEWHYHTDDDEILESGKEYADISKLPFVFKSHV